jgi:hypothetical protein
LVGIKDAVLPGAGESLFAMARISERIPKIPP